MYEAMIARGKSMPTKSLLHTFRSAIVAADAGAPTAGPRPAPQSRFDIAKRLIERVLLQVLVETFDPSRLHQDQKARTLSRLFPSRHPRHLNAGFPRSRVPDADNILISGPALELHQGNPALSGLRRPGDQIS
ncbi:MAG: hypothetical protein OEW98_00340 [Betaproteobacteria bacterium]|nr:hypothetical protein [Betaproteobacteria bacterium]